MIDERDKAGENGVERHRQGQSQRAAVVRPGGDRLSQPAQGYTIAVGSIDHSYRQGQVAGLIHAPPCGAQL